MWVFLVSLTCCTSRVLLSCMSCLQRLQQQVIPYHLAFRFTTCCAYTLGVRRHVPRNSAAARRPSSGRNLRRVSLDAIHPSKARHRRRHAPRVFRAPKSALGRETTQVAALKAKHVIELLEKKVGNVFCVCGTDVVALSSKYALVSHTRCLPIYTSSCLSSLLFPHGSCAIANLLVA